jgi:hypothetical protein
VSRCILGQCEKVAAQADRYERAQEQTTEANKRADRADVCEKKGKDDRRKIICLTVGNVALGLAAGARPSRGRRNRV